MTIEDSDGPEGQQGALYMEETALYEVTRREITSLVDRITDDVDLDVDADGESAFWTNDKLWIRYNWDWEASPEEGGYRVRQQVYVPEDLYALSILLLPFALVAMLALYSYMLYLSLRGFPLNSSLNAETIIVLGAPLVITLLVFLPISIVFRTMKLTRAVNRQMPTPLVDDRNHSVSFNRYTGEWVKHLLLGAAFVTFLPLIYTNSLRVAVTASLFWLSILVVLGLIVVSPYGDAFVRIRRHLTSGLLIPPIGYQAFVVRSYIVFPLFILAVFVVTTPARFPLLGLFDLVFAILIVSHGRDIYKNLDTTWLKLGYHGFTDNPNRTFDRLGTFVAVGANLAVSVVAVCSFVVVWTSVGGSTALEITPLVATLIALYLPLGSVFQVYSSQRFVNHVRVHSEPYQFSTSAFEAVYPVWKYTGPEDIAPFALYGRNQQVIVLPSWIVDEFSPSETAAIVAHEEAHLTYKDAKLSARLTMLGSLLLIGQVVLYELVDFYNREARADRYAADRVGHDAMISALQRLQSVSRPDTSGSQQVLLSRLNSDVNGAVSSTEELLSRKLQLFHGGYTLTEAHPRLSHRIRELRAVAESTKDDGR